MKTFQRLITAFIVLAFMVAGAAVLVHQDITAEWAVGIGVALCGLQAAIIAQRGRNRDRDRDEDDN